MDDPTRRCENDTDHGDALLGALVPKQGPHFFAHRTVARAESAQACGLSYALIDLPRYRNIQMPQHVLHFRFPQS